MRPSLETARLRLTAVRPGDVEDLHAMFATAAAHMASAGALPAPAETRTWVHRRMAVEREHGLVWYVLRDRRTGELIGNCGLFARRTGVAEPELGYEVVHAHREQGYATEAARAVLVEADASGIPRVWVTVRPGNAASLRVAAKIGMVYVRCEVDDRGELLYLSRARP
ncbi:GNAT family N-acetyltransferase [Planosporangium sp. 12N6]|uniref:GNAT family N-acetyltransferase n=1 Tax=Planosporangium spinosum TaxID=3402278 RepID=UPI003CEAF4C6